MEEFNLVVVDKHELEILNVHSDKICNIFGRSRIRFKEKHTHARFTFKSAATTRNAYHQFSNGTSVLYEFDKDLNF